MMVDRSAIVEMTTKMREKAEGAHFNHNKLKWNCEEIFMSAAEMSINFFKQDLIVDDDNREIIELLCLYFSNDSRFISKAEKKGIQKPCLSKGIMLAGPVGSGKTHLMKCFSNNPAFPFRVEYAKPIASAYEEKGQEAIRKYCWNNTIDVSEKSFYAKVAGIAIDDLGNETSPKKFMGNETNVICDIIEARYENRCLGVFFHATTNLNLEQQKKKYGERVDDRLAQTMNGIVLSGKSRRINGVYMSRETPEYISRTKDKMVH